MEEIDLIFAEAYSDRSLGGYVKHSKTRPRITGRELDIQLEQALRAGKLRQRNGGPIEHVEDVGGEKRGNMRRLDDEKKAPALEHSDSSSSNESATARGSLSGAKGESTMREFAAMEK